MNSTQTYRTIPCIAVMAEGRLLLLQRKADSKYPNMWCIPGGKMESGETEASCATRELLEETGLQRQIEDYTISWNFVRDEYNLHTFVIEYEKIPQVRLESNFQGFGWFTKAEVAALHHMRPALEIFETLEKRS